MRVVHKHRFPRILTRSRAAGKLDAARSTAAGVDRGPGNEQDRRQAVQRRCRSLTPSMGSQKRELFVFDHLFGQGTVTVCVTVSPVSNVASYFPVKPPRGHVVGTLP
jgi:hypothetical protein